jgi:hypothetical protein
LVSALIAAAASVSDSVPSALVSVMAMAGVFAVTPSASRTVMLAAP